MMRLLMFCLFPTVPAMTIIRKESAKDQRKALLKGHKNKDLVKESVLEELDVLTEYINETSLGTIHILHRHF